MVKGHSAHPGTGEVVAQAIDAAVKACGLHPGVFSLIQGGKRDVGTGLVQHPLIKAVGFTGSLAGGAASGAMGGLSALAETGAGKLPPAPLDSVLTEH